MASFTVKVAAVATKESAPAPPVKAAPLSRPVVSVIFRNQYTPFLNQQQLIYFLN
jgi:hypothetical protein